MRKLKNGQEIITEKAKYRVVNGELYRIKEELIPDYEPNIPLDLNLIRFYERKGYNVCPSCGGNRNDPPLTGCPKGSHYGTYC